MSALVLFFALLGQVLRSTSAPVASTRDEQAIIHWAGEPQGRGTFRLVVSCTVTLVLCVWTALHLNIPKENETRGSRWIRKLSWTLVALFAPELVVHAAWRQSISAEALCHEMNMILDERTTRAVCVTSPISKGAPYFPWGETQKDPIGEDGRWTKMHAYYAGMGGITLEVDLSTEPFIPEPLPPQTTQFRGTLTSHGVLLLARCGRLPRISRKSIADKSKADSLAKLLACMQAFWSLLQCISRFASRLPITLLEINTLGHALCALVIYVLWWHKPLDITEPHVLSGEWVKPLFAYMWMSSGTSELRHPRGTGTELQNVSYTSPDDIGQLPPIRPGQSTIRLRAKERLVGTCFTYEPKAFPQQKRIEFGRTPFHQEGPSAPKAIVLTITDMRRWKLSSEAIMQYPAVMKLATTGRRDIGRTTRTVRHELLVTTSPNWPGKDLLKGKLSQKALAVALAFASAAYGGLHASAWNGFFPTQRERTLWRIASAAVTASGLVTSMWVATESESRSDIDSVLLALVFLAIYSCCRLFLVLEAFISIRALPVDAYRTPSWSQLVPHI